MPSPLDALLDQSELSQLYMYLLKHKVKDQYRGHQDYHLMLKAIDSEFPIVGGNIKVQKEDKNGNFSTVTYHVTVKDDLGNFIQSIDDLGGQCMKGEIVKKGYIFTCMECGQPFCRRHVKFVDNDPKKPLCRYGFMGWEGCHFSHKGGYSDGGIAKIRTETERLEALGDYEQARKKLEAIQKGQLALEGEAEQQRQPALPPPKKKTGLLGRLLHGSVYSVRCGNCNEMIAFADIVCPSCRNIIDIDIDSALKCPVCGADITEVDCPRCEATNKL